MKRVFAIAGLVFVCGVVSADEPQQQDSSRTPADVAAEIDTLFADSWSRNEVIPAPIADDAEYLRRVYLDLAGRIPAVSEVRSFLADQSPDKRSKVVSELLNRPTYVRHMTIAWRNALIPQAMSEPQFRFLVPGFEAWLWQHIAYNTPYDEMVRDVISTELTQQVQQPGVLQRTTSPEAFYIARQLQPENLATGVSRAFLGVRLDCAQCHDHPFDQWKQDEFWKMAAFFASVAPDTDADGNVMAMTMNERRDRRSIRIPETDDEVMAVFLDGSEPEWNESSSPRTELADWIVRDDNPWFAKMAANRVWNQFFGRGIVEPVDEFSPDNPPSHPKVLDLLARELIAHDYDLQFLIRTITATDVYQRTSRQTDASQSEPSDFARAALRGLTPEQFFDSLAEAVGFYQPYRSDNPFVLDDNSPRARFIELFRNEAESSHDRETTILQALAMMNGDFVSDATDLDGSRTLRAVVEFPLMEPPDKLETLFLASVSRKPNENEQKRLLEYVSGGGYTGDEKDAWSDIFWSLLNSSEFLLNH